MSDISSFGNILLTCLTINSRLQLGTGSGHVYCQRSPPDQRPLASVPRPIPSHAGPETVGCEARGRQPSDARQGKALDGSRRPNRDTDSTDQGIPNGNSSVSKSDTA